MQKIAFFIPKRYKNGSETEVGVRAVLLFDFKKFLALLLWAYYGALWGEELIGYLMGACIVVLLLVLKHENIVRSLSR